MDNFLFIGGDSRLVYAAEKLNKHFDCFIYGQEKTKLAETVKIPALREVTKCKNVVLGLPASNDGETINAPNASGVIYPEIITHSLETGGRVFAGKSFEKLSKLCETHNFLLFDYFEREELAVMNSVPSAEGAIEVLMRESDVVIYGMNILITGFGRLAKVLSKYLIALGARVTIAARKYSDLSWAQITGCESVHMSNISLEIGKFDVIFNTVPSEIFGEKEVKAMKPGLLFIELASKLSVSENAPVKLLWERSLPGRVAPITAGRIIADTIMNIITQTERESSHEN